MNRTHTEQALIMTINRLSRSYRRAVNRALAVPGLSDSQALPVLFLSRLGDGVRQGVLAEELGIEGPSLVRQLDQLQAAGLVERRDDPQDRRAKNLHLTEAGHRFAARIEAMFNELRGELLTGISDQDLATCLRVLHSFEQAVQTHLESPPSTTRR